MASSQMRDLLRVRPVDGVVALVGYNPAATPGAPGGKKKAARMMVKRGAQLAELQERLYAEATVGGVRRVLVVLQGMDTSGKGGVIDHVMGLVGPAGCHITSFKKPTPEELAHHFLWRIRKGLPGPGSIGVFDRSHYEDVLVVRVHDVIDDAECAHRYDEINRFERELVEGGTTILKCFLNVSYDMQRERLLERLDQPDKNWKFNEGDINERAFWPAYQDAYSAALAHTSTDIAPWYAIPSDHKWYRNWAIGELLRENLEDLDPQYPQVDLDIDRLKDRLQPPF
ncbi:MAG: PPK2 family polyphosphate kinase [Jatrophihabitans sp.]